MKRPRNRDQIDWKPVFAAAIISGGMVALAFLATWYFQ
jgi:hypothetical protein